MERTYRNSILLHRKLKGKLEVIGKINIKNRRDLSLAYTPGVAAVCREIARDPNSIYAYTGKRNMVAVVTDGSAVLGLGNIGPLAALPVMEGKAMLFKKMANIDAFPICLDIQDEDAIVNTVKFIAPVFGGINLEDISAPRCFSIEKRLKELLNIPVMHDDQHGTATVILAGLINSLKLRRTDKKDVSIVVNGAGAAGTATAELLLAYGIKNIIVCDRQGPIWKGRPGLSEAKHKLAARTNAVRIKGSLADALKGADVFIGVSAGGVVKKNMISRMNSKPIVFAMANPIPEIMPHEAKKGGAFIVGTGRSDFPNQINNVLAFPGIFRGALDNGVKQITENMLINAAIALASHTHPVSREHILPSPFDLGVVRVVSGAVK